MKRSVSLILFLIIFTLSVFVLNTGHSFASFNQNDLMDDGVFDNSTSMSATSIDSFLNQFSGSCISTNNGFSTADPQGWSDAQNKYLFGSNVSGGQAIYDVAQLYHINPQVILATLQKEQSVVTGAKGCHYDRPNPQDSSQLYTCTMGSQSTTCTDACPFSYGGGCMNIAMSYGCPGSCKAADEGFSLQLTLGTWLLRFSEQRAYGKLNGYVGYETGDESLVYSGPMTTGWRQRVSGGSSDYYDGTYTLADGTHVFIGSGATASLYTYTPFINGNKSFVDTFEGWFGSAVGELLRTSSDPTVYLVNGAVKYPIADINIYNDFSPLGLRFVDPSELPATTGQTVGRMVQGADGASLYFVNAGIKLGFTSCAPGGDVEAYGYDCSSNSYIPLTIGQTNKLVNGPNVTRLFKSNNDGTIYYMSKAYKRPFTTMDDIQGMHLNQGINVFTDAYVRSLPTWYPIFKPGSLVKYSNSASIYEVSDPDNAFQIGSFAYPQEMGLSTSYRIISGGFSPGAILENKLLCNGNDYISTNGNTYKASSTILTAYGWTSDQFLTADNICANIKISQTPLSQYIRTPDGTVYYVNSGQKQAFTSYNTYQSASYCNNSCTLISVSTLFASSIPSGSNL
jgi:hypothetical protein